MTGEHVFVEQPVKLSSNRKGAIAEAELAAAAIRIGIPVLKPLAEHGRYDLAFDLGDGILRVQCKWGSLKKDVVVVRTSSSYYSPTRGYVKTTYAKNEVDAIGVYCAEMDRCYVLPIALFEDRSQVILRLSGTKNNQRAALNWAADYELGAVAQLAERLNGIQEAGGSSPPSSTRIPNPDHVEVGAHEFRNRFGWYMQRAAGGERLLITRRNKPFARLLPPDTPQSGWP
jgi:prevent-host-death family protein